MNSAQHHLAVGLANKSTHKEGDLAEVGRRRAVPAMRKAKAAAIRNGLRVLQGL